MADRDLLQAIADVARAIFKAQAASIALLDGEGFRFEAVSGRGEWMVGARFAPGEGIAGAVASSGEPAWVPDLDQDPRFARDLAERTGYVPRTMMVAPLKTTGAVSGVISVLDRGDGGEETALLAAFADLAVLAL